MESAPQENLEKESINGWEISLQGELISESKMDKKEWIKNYSPKYRKLIDANPQLAEECLDDKEAVKEKISNWLYQGETIH